MNYYKLFPESNYRMKDYRIKEIYFILLKQYTINQKNIKSIKKNKDDEKTTIKCFFCGHDKLRSLKNNHSHPSARARWKYYKVCNKCNKCSKMEGL